MQVFLRWSLVMIACGHGLPYAASSPTLDALSTFSQQGPQGASVPLAELAPGPWDRVHCFQEGTRREDVDRALGVPLFGAPGFLHDPGPLLVFVADGEVVEAIVAIPPLFVSCAAPSLARDEARVRAHSKPPAPHLLVLEASAGR